MKEFRISAHSLGMFACPFRGYMYRHLQKAAVTRSAALVQGTAGHASLAAWRRALPLEAQEKAVYDIFARNPTPPEDFRTAGLLKEVLVQYRAQYSIEDFVWEEIEKDFELELGSVTGFDGDYRVIFTGRRDAVAWSPSTGERYVVDDKFVSRDEGAELASARNSRALKGYLYEWNYSNPGKRTYQAILRRTVIRKPTQKMPVNFTLPADPPLFFSEDRLQEWRLNTLSICAQILQRDPEVIDQWPMEESLCRTTFGCCDYLDVCTQPPGLSRMRLLDSPAFCLPHSDKDDAPAE